MTFPILGGNGAVASYSIDNSLRFNDGDSPKLERTPSSAGNRKTWTWSAWVKRSNLSTTQKLFMAYGANNEGGYTGIDLDPNSFRVAGYASSIETTTAVLRDVSAWYHLMVVFDTTQATEANRVKMYINGEQAATSQGSSHPAQNFEPAINNNVIHAIGARYTSSATGEFFDGYMTEVNFVDGAAKAPTDFGEFDDNGVWIPKKYEGTYGTNGFFLQFKQTGTSQNASGIGADTSGNGNHFAVSNLAASDVTEDTCTNNYATWNVLNKNSNITTSEGNNRLNATGSWGNIIGSIGAKNSGKWYWEVYFVSGTAGRLVGIANPEFNTSSTSTPIGVDTAGFSWGYQGGGNKYHENVSPAYGDSFGAGDIIGVALDLDGGNLTFYKNNTSQGVAYSSLPDLYYLPALSLANTEVAVINCGQDGSFAGNLTAQGNADGNGYGDFYYAPPSGYLALCTQNLATELSPTIDDGSDYFNTVLFTGNGANDHAITGVGFQPDWVWLKGRNSADGNNLWDINRGVNNRLFTHNTNAELADTNSLKSFDSDGFTMDNDAGINGSGDTYVTWNWLGSNTTASNTDGTITSTVSANQTSGFSVVTFTGTGSNVSVGHGLNQAPEIFFAKSRVSGGTNWNTYTSVIDGSLDFLFLNSNQAAGNASNSLPTSSVIYQNQTDSSVAYCFHSVEGYSKIGKYTGNGSTDGTFVYTGFRPAWVLRKCSTAAEQWHIQDTKRLDFNNDSNSAILIPSTDAPEATNTNLLMDILSNGFKCRASDGAGNGSGRTYIYMAFAENPFVTSSSVPVVAR